MKVSIIIPAYNEESCIRETLQAVIAQDYDDLEIIVVDNNCTDRTGEIALEFPKVKLVKETNRGTQFARERGRKESTGHIIANLDADCLPAFDWVSKSVRHFDDPKVVAVTGPYNYYDGTLFFRLGSAIVQKGAYSLINTISFLLLKNGICLIGGNMHIRAKTLENIGGYNTTIVFYGDDTDTAKRLAALGKIIYSSKLAVKSSARRFKEFGVTKVFGKYLLSYFDIMLFNKPYSNKIEDYEDKQK